MDELGPYSIPALRAIAAAFPPTAPKSEGGNGTLVRNASSGLGAAMREVLEGTPVVFLWLQTPSFGHFVLLHYRTLKSGKRILEFFDPLGSDDGEQSWKMYMDDPPVVVTSGGSSRKVHLNDGGLRPYLQEIFPHVEITYNQPSNAPQPEQANSCGLWCLLRSAAPNCSPTKFARAT